MTTFRLGCVTVALISTGLDASAAARSMLSDVTHKVEQVGECFDTHVARVENRLEDNGKPVPDSGSQIELTDGHVTTSYDQVPAIDTSRTGDPVRLCVIKLPTQCPPGDHRGITYRGKNLRTGQSWTAADAEHFCGGA